MIHLANAPVSWGVIEYAWGATHPWRVVLDEIARAGYNGTELGPYGYLPTDAATLQQELADRKLSLISAFVPLTVWDKEALNKEVADLKAVAALLKACRARWIVLALTAVPERMAKVARATVEDGWDAATWTNAGQTLNSLARTLKQEFGLFSVFHHHMGTYVETPAEVQNLLVHTDPNLLGLCLDTGHYAFGGGDPLALLQSAGDRIPYLHFKDIDANVLARVKTEGLNYEQAVAAKVYCELGAGIAKLPAVVRLLNANHYDGWAVVEQDIMPGSDTDPFAAAVRSRVAVEGWLYP